MKYIKSDYLIRKYKENREEDKLSFEDFHKLTKIKLKTIEKEFISWDDFQFMCELKLEKNKKNTR